MALESKFQSKLIKEIKKRFPGCMVLKNDSSYIQGIPDLTVLWKKHWAVLECKKNVDSSHRPNQDLYVRKLDKMSFSSFIYPENKDEILDRMEKKWKQ